MRRRSPHAIATLTIVLLGVGLLTTDFILERLSIGALQAQRQAVRTAGFPASADDIRKRLPAPPADQNAAPQYRKALQALDLMPREDRDRIVALRGSPGELAKLMARMGPVLDQFESASQKPFCHWDRRWEEAWALLLPEMAGLRTAGTMFVTRAKQRASTDPGGALDDLQAAARMANHLGQEPFLIAHLLRAGLETGVSDALLEILSKSPDAPARRSRALEILAAMGPPSDPAFAVLTEPGAWFLHFDAVSAPSGSELRRIYGQPDEDPTWRERAGRLPFMQRQYRTECLTASVRLAKSLRAAGSDPVKIGKALSVRDREVNAASEKWGDDLARSIVAATGGWTGSLQTIADSARRRADLRTEILRLTSPSRPAP